MEGRRWEQEEICFYKRRFFQVGRAEMVEQPPWEVARAVSPAPWL